VPEPRHCVWLCAACPLRPGRNLPRAHLFVGVDQYECVLELLLLHDGVELLLADAYPLHVAAVNHVDDGLRVGVVTPPVRPYAGLTAQVPHLELDVLVGHSLNVEPDRCRHTHRGRGGRVRARSAWRQDVS
jgi:hypothetical protein